MYWLLLHRIPREFKVNWLKYIIMIIVVMISIFAIVSFTVSYDSMAILTVDTATTCKVEDGEFTLLLPMQDDEVKGLTDKGVKVEEEFYFDATTKDDQDLRVFKVRNSINTIQIVDGEIPTKDNEILVNRLFATNQELSVDDTLTIGDKKYTISGIGVTPDYNYVYKDLSIAVSTSKNFGTAFLSSAGYDALKSTVDSLEIYNYAYRLESSGLSDDDVKQYLIDDVSFDYKTVEDPYYQEFIARNTRDQQKLKDSIQNLYDSFSSIADGLEITKDMMTDLGTCLDDFAINEKAFDGAMIEFDSDVSTSSVSKLIELLNNTSLTDSQQSTVTALANQLYTLTDTIDSKATEMANTFDTYITKAEDIKKEGLELQSESFTKVSDALNNLLEPTTAYTLTKDNYKDIFKAVHETTYDEDSEDQLKIMESSLDSVSGFETFINTYINSLTKAKETMTELASYIKKDSSSTKSSLAKIASSSTDTISLLEKKYLAISIGSKYNLYRQLFNEVISYTEELASDYEENTLSLNATIVTLNLLVKQLGKLNDTYGEALEEAKNAVLNDVAQFVPQKENARILTSYYRANQYTNIIKTIGAIICVVLGYILSVFATQQINQDVKNIGTLYSMGVTKGNLIMYYLTIPLLISFIGGLLGFGLSVLPLGIINVYKSMEISGASVCEYHQVIQPYIYVFCLVGPSLITFLVNLIVVSGKLNKKPIVLLNNISEDKQAKDFKFVKKLKFIKAFQVRQISREAKTGFMVGFGVFACTVILMLGLGVDGYAANSYNNTVNSLNYNYMTVYKYAPEEVPSGAEGHYMVSLKIDSKNSNNSVSLIGINNDSKYYPNDIVTPGVNKVTINRTFANKYSLGIDSSLILSDSANNQDYIFYVENITDYEVGLIAFMDEDSMLTLFGKSEGYYNMTLSDKEVDCESGRIYSVVTKDQLLTYANNQILQTRPIVVVILSASFLIMGLVMYILLGIMIDKSNYGISLLKVLGYNRREVSRIYLNPNLFFILTATVISIPLGKVLADLLVKFATLRLPAGLDLSVPWYWYVTVAVGTIVAYFISTLLLQRKLNKIGLAEALKSRG